MLRRLTLFLWALSSPLLADGLGVDAPENIAALLRPHLPAEPGNPRKIEALLGEILATEGYFSPKFEFSGADDERRVKIDPGPRTTIASVDLAVNGPIAAEKRDALVASWGLSVGQPFRQEDWNNAKQQVLGELLRSEHSAARLLDSRAEIDTETHRAKLTVHYDSGPRYRFGALEIDGLQRYSPALIERYNRAVNPGDPYNEEKLNVLLANLQATPYFASVQGGLDLEGETVSHPDGSVSVPLRLIVRERALHRLAFGAGVSSNTGARVEFNYHTPNLFNQAWALDSGLRLEQKKQTVYGDIFLPPDARHRRNSLGLMLGNTDIQGLKTERYAFGAQSVQQRGSVTQHLSLNWQNEIRTPQGAEESTSRALVPNVMWTWRRVDSLLDPRQGIVLQAQIGGGAKSALSDQNFVRLHGRWQQYIPLGRSDTLSLRAEVGYTLADSRQHIPQDYLFRAGGSGSVRGYAYQSLGIKEGNATVGGRYLGILSAEATHWLDESWGIAAFIDAGDAVDDLKTVKAAIGYGLGARWRSPAGPIGVDLAYGQRTSELQLHFSLAIPF